MKVSLNIVKYYGSGFDPLANGGIDAVVRRVGAQLGAIEDVVKTGPRYEGAVVVTVVSCEKHPAADKLHVCKIDDGGVVKDVDRDKDGFVQVVCGAPNVRTGLTVIWLPPRSIVPSTFEDKEPFVLGVRELRGVVSNGMLASANELGISDDHQGILEVAASDVGNALMKQGTPLRKLYGLDDVILDLENKMFTHRPDCFGALGVARELAGIAGESFISPDWYKQPLKDTVSSNTLPLTVTNSCDTVVPRFMVQIVSGLSVGPSPLWMQSYLSRIGIKSINNIVDMTNYYMMLTGQPLHAFDYDKLVAHSNKPSLGPRMAKDGEELTLLGGKKVKLTSSDIVIATDNQAVALAGVMGGEQTEVDASTKTIALECATFDMYSIRRSSMRHGLFTDAVTRYTKGQSPLQNDRVLAKIVDDLVQSAGGIVASEPFDLKRHDVKEMPAVITSSQFINDRLGSNLSADAIKTLLENVEFQVEIRNTDVEISIKPPFWRTDIELPEDIVEEIGRLYGYDRLPISLPERPSMPVSRIPLLQLKSRVRSALKAIGANEVLSYSFVHEKLLRNSGQDPTAAYKLSNALSPDLQYYRLSLTPSLLEKVHPNLKAGYEQFALYEVGKGHNQQHMDDDGIPEEFESLSLVFAANAKNASQGAAYYRARLLLDALGQSLGLAFTYNPISEKPKNPVYGPFDHTRSAIVSMKNDDTPLGIVGEYSSATKNAHKLPVSCAGFELDLAALLKTLAQGSAYQPLPKFPKVTQDISLKVANDVLYGDMRQCLEQAIESAQPNPALSRLDPVDIYMSESGQKHMTFRLSIAHYERTLTADEVNSLLDVAATAAKEQFSAIRL